MSITSEGCTSYRNHQRGHNCICGSCVSTYRAQDYVQGAESVGAVLLFPAGDSVNQNLFREG